jgi:ribosomal-protein-alanine N-acetyltransferase
LVSIELPQTSHVTLRFVTAEDESRFLELANASIEFHENWVRMPRTPGDFAHYLARSDRVNGACLVVCSPVSEDLARELPQDRSQDRSRGLSHDLEAGGDLVGMVGVNGIVRGPYQRGVLGYAVFQPYAGRGYMTAGVALAVHYAFDQLGLHRLEADIQPGNTASLRLVRRLGFRREGLSPGFIRIGDVWRDHERWSLTRDMPLPAVPLPPGPPGEAP